MQKKTSLKFHQTFFHLPKKTPFYSLEMAFVSRPVQNRNKFKFVKNIDSLGGILWILASVMT